MRLLSALPTTLALPVLLADSSLVEPAASPDPQQSAKASALVLLLTLIAIVGIVLLAIVLVMGGRTRRIARDPSEATTHDPFQTLRAESGRKAREADENPPAD